MERQNFGSFAHIKTEQYSFKSCVVFGVICFALILGSSLLAGQTYAAGMSGDSDNDGVPDSLDVDDDNDTIPDGVEGLLDADNDGIANCFDLDSDNDGITDLVEAVSGAGMIRQLDSNEDGVLDSTVPVGSNGLADVAEQMPGSDTSIYANTDSDNDGIRDYVDLDSDNDGIPDILEAGSSDTDRNGKYDFFLDLNSDGFADRLSSSPIAARDTDGDGLDDYIDTDSDQDGLSDVIETSGTDGDNDGRLDSFSDSNGDGLDDAYMTSFAGLADTDSDGFPDYRDTDSDGDGVLDSEEATSDVVVTKPVQPTTPFSPPTQTKSDSLTLVTGENGNVFGCVTSSAATRDPMFLLLALASMLVILYRCISSVRNVFIVLLGLVTVGCATSPLQGSRNPIDSAETTFAPYAGIGLGASFLNANTKNKPLEQDEDISVAGQLTIGSTVGDHAAVELRVADLGEISFTNGAAVGYQVVDLTGMYRYRFNALTGFGRLGVGSLSNDGDINTRQNNPSHLVIGAGFDYFIADQLSVRAEWQGHDVDVMHSQVSLLYRFGRQASTRPPVVIAQETTEAADDKVIQPTIEPIAKSTVEPEITPIIKPEVKPSLKQNIESENVKPDVKPTAEAIQELEKLQIEQVDNKVAVLGSGTVETLPRVEKPRQDIERPKLKALTTVPIKKKKPAPKAAKPVSGIVDATRQCPDQKVGNSASLASCSLFGDIVQGLTFDTETDKLTSSGESVLDGVAVVLDKDKTLQLNIVSHTEPADDAQAALFLTRRRTIAIIRYLADKGIDTERLKPEAFGDKQPLASGKNDRVSLLVE